jgi:short-subunit dehydrogenase
MKQTYRSVMKENVMEFVGQTALITGASTGIGAVFARQFAARGAHLILVARSEDRLRALAAELSTAHGVTVDVLATDLTRPGAGADLADRVAALGRSVDVLVNNAGFATHGDVAQADPDRLLEQIQLNCTAVVDLTTRFLPAMTTRHHGPIINVASTAGFQPIAHMAVYAATRVLYMSGYAQPVLASQGTLDPGVILVEKPFTERGLLDRIRTVLDKP